MIRLAAFIALAAAALYWAKWAPYSQQLAAVALSHSLGASMLGVNSQATVQSGLSYCFSYFKSIWPALIAGLVVAAGVEALAPRQWLLKLMASGGPLRRVLVGGALAVPSLMCTCCAAPPAVALRRSGVPVTTALAYWLGNPSLNLAVFAFAAFVLPWQLVALRVASGIVLVFVAVPLIGRFLLHDDDRLTDTPVLPAQNDAIPSSRLAVGRRFVTSLGRLAVTLVPEYVVIIFALGALRGLLFPVVHTTGFRSLALIVPFALAGTAFAVPTGGELPIVQGLVKAGVATGPAAALLLTLPAVSLPSAVMVGRSFRRRAILAVAGAVALIGVADGLLAQALLG